MLTTAKNDGDSTQVEMAAGTIAKTEAGEGMFGADIELDSLTGESGSDAEDKSDAEAE